MFLHTSDIAKRQGLWAVPILGVWVLATFAVRIEAAQILFASEVIAPHSRLIQVDPATGATIGTFPFQETIIIGGMAFDPSSTELLGSSTSLGNHSLYKIDMTDGTYTLVGALGRYFPALAVQPQTHTLFGMTLDDDLYTIDKNTGMSTIVGGDPALSYPHGLAFSPTGVLYASDTAGFGTSKLFRVDPSDGMASFIGTMPYDYVVSLAFDQHGVLYGYDNGNNSLIRIDPNTGSAVTIGGSGSDDYLAIEFVPEPQTLLMMTLVGLVFFRCRRVVA